MEISKIQAELNKHDELVKQQRTEEEREKSGLAPKKIFNLQDKLRALKAKDADKEEEKVVDPYTVKVRKFNSEMNERDLRDIMIVYGEISRVKVPMDQENPLRNKGIGFVTYVKSEDCTKVIEEGSIKYEFYELPVERAFYSAGMAEKNRGGGGGGGRGGWEDRGDGDRRGGFRGGRDGEGRGGFRGRDGEGGEGRGGYRGRGGGDGERRGGFRGRDDGAGWGRRD